MPDFGKYEKFVSDWHYFAKEMGQKIKSFGSEGQEKSKALCLYILKKFYMEPFDASVDFYEQFNKRLVVFPFSGISTFSPSILTEVRGTWFLEVVRLNLDATSIPKVATPAQQNR